MQFVWQAFLLTKIALPIPPPKKSISRCSCILSFAFQNLLLRKVALQCFSFTKKSFTKKSISRYSCIAVLGIDCKPSFSFTDNCLYYSLSCITTTITLSLACYAKVIGPARLMHCTIAQLHIYDVFPFASLTINCLPPRQL